jgi:hypothetical protein
MSQPHQRPIQHSQQAAGGGGLIEGGRTFKSTTTPLPPYTATPPPVHLFAGARAILIPFLKVREPMSAFGRIADINGRQSHVCF